MAARSELAALEEVITALRGGELIVVLADEEGDPEGYVCLAAEAATPVRLRTMLDTGAGLIYVPMAATRVARLRLADMAGAGADPALSAATVSVDLAEPAARGLSIAERVRCIHRLADPDARPQDFRSPGHVFPVRARPRGLFDRQGMAEAATDLARLAGMAPVVVTCKILNADGSDARGDSVLQWAQGHGCLTTSVSALLAHRRTQRSSVELLAEGQIPTPHGAFTLMLFRSEMGPEEHVAMVKGDVRGDREVLVRVQHECLLGDVFRSSYCACRTRLDRSLQRVAAAGAGVVIYLRGPEWRLGASHEDDLADSAGPTARPDRPADARDYAPAAQILAELGVTKVRLLSNRPGVPQGLAHRGLHIAASVPIDDLAMPDAPH